MSDKFNVTFEFDNGTARSHFVHWLCGQGEQDYWLWMEYREREKKDDIDITVGFEYHKHDAYDTEKKDVKVICECVDEEE